MNFKNALLQVADANENGEIECTEAASYDSDLDVSGLNIGDVTGLQAFINVANFNCSNNNIEIINTTGLTSLAVLDISYNAGITAVDISSNVSLTNFYCQHDNITVLNTVNNTALVQLNCDNNNLTLPDISLN